MSIPMRAYFIDSSENIHGPYSLGTRSYGSKSGNIAHIREQFVLVIPMLERMESLHDIEYGVCTEAIDYMFDSSGKMLPNKCKDLMK